MTRRVLVGLAAAAVALGKLLEHGPVGRFARKVDAEPMPLLQTAAQVGQAVASTQDGRRAARR